MAIDFPSTNGQATDGSFTHTHNGLTWVWNGTSWSKQASYLASQDLTSFSVVKPNPTPFGNGDLQYDNTTGEFEFTPPDVPAAQVQSDWDVSGTLGEILNKPTIPVNINDLNNVNTTPSLDHVLKWDNTNSEWISGTLSTPTSGGSILQLIQETGPTNEISAQAGMGSGAAWIDVIDKDITIGNETSKRVKIEISGEPKLDGFRTMRYEIRLIRTTSATVTVLYEGYQGLADSSDNYSTMNGVTWIDTPTGGTHNYKYQFRQVISWNNSVAKVEPDSMVMLLTEIDLNASGGSGGGGNTNLSDYVKKSEASSTTISRSGSSYLTLVSDFYIQLSADQYVRLDGNNSVNINSSTGPLSVSVAGGITLSGGGVVHLQGTRVDFNDTSNVRYAFFDPSGLNLLTSGIKDKDGNLGTSGQILSSTGTSVDWIDATGQANVQSNWTVTDTGHDAYIQNKPSTFSNGNTGFVPAPLANGNNSAHFLRGDGTWATPVDTNTNTTYNVVDTVNHGLAPVLPATHGGKYLRADGTWEVPPDTNTDTNTTYSLGAIDASGGSKVIRLLTGAGASAGDVILMEGTGISLSRSGNSITLESTATGGTTSSIPSGTAMMFAQGSAPTGWTKSGSHNNKALRVVSGSGGGSGGSVGFTSAFTSHSTSGTVSFTVDEDTGNQTATGSIGNTTSSGNATSTSLGNTGNGGSDSHSFSGNTGDKTIYINDVTGNTTLSSGQLASHSHNFHRTRYATASGGGGTPGAEFGTMSSGAWSETNTQNHGSGSSHYHDINVSNTHNHSFSGSISTSNHNHSMGSHSHGLSMNSHNHTFTGDAHNHEISFTASGTSSMNDINLSVTYVDVIICTKD